MHACISVYSCASLQMSVDPIMSLKVNCLYVQATSQYNHMYRHFKKQPLHVLVKNTSTRCDLKSAYCVQSLAWSLYQQL